MQIEGLTPEPLRSAGNITPDKVREEAKLKDACQQFEQLYLTNMFKEMRKCNGGGEKMGQGGSGGGEGGGGSQEQDMFQGMLDEERAKAWSQSGGVGLASLLFEQMKKTL